MKIIWFSFIVASNKVAMTSKRLFLNGYPGHRIDGRSICIYLYSYFSNSLTSIFLVIVLVWLLSIPRPARNLGKYYSYSYYQPRNQKPLWTFNLNISNLDDKPCDGSVTKLWQNLLLPSPIFESYTLSLTNLHPFSEIKKCHRHPVYGIDEFALLRLVFDHSGVEGKLEPVSSGLHCAVPTKVRCESDKLRYS